MACENTLTKGATLLTTPVDCSSSLPPIYETEKQETTATTTSPSQGRKITNKPQNTTNILKTPSPKAIPSRLPPSDETEKQATTLTTTSVPPQPPPRLKKIPKKFRSTTDIHQSSFTPPELLSKETSTKNMLEQTLETLFTEKPKDLHHQLLTILKTHLPTASHEVQELIKRYLENELGSGDECTWLRTQAPGTLLWTAYTFVMLFATESSSSNFAQFIISSEQHKPIFLLESLIEVLSTYPGSHLTQLASINQFICKQIQEKTENAPKVIVQAITLQCFARPIAEKGRVDLSKALLASFQPPNDDIEELVQGLEALLISGEEDASSYSLRQAIVKYDRSLESCEKVARLLNQSSKNSELLEAALPALCHITTSNICNLIEQLMPSSKDQAPLFLIDTPSTLIWRLYMQNTLSPLIPIENLGKLTKKNLDNIPLFWTVRLVRLQSEKQSLAKVKSVNENFKAHFVSEEQFLEALLLAYFIPQILRYAQNTYPTKEKKLARFIHFVKELRASLKSIDGEIPKSFAALFFKKKF
jgi:hypothetical protein